MPEHPLPDDNRTRMAANFGAAIAILIVLVLGYWLMGALMQQSKNEDCLLSHRRSCSTIGNR